MAPEICPLCGDNRSLENHDLCSMCATDTNLADRPRCDLSAEEKHKLAQQNGSILEGYRGDGL